MSNYFGVLGSHRQQAAGTTSALHTVNRRQILAGVSSLAALTVSGCAVDPKVQQRIARRTAQNEAWAYYESLYGAQPHEVFPIPKVDLRKVNSRFFRREVENPTGAPVGTVVVDTRNFYLYWVESYDKAIRYGVGLGRAGFSWNGEGVIQWKQPWPIWTPPREMIEREPELEKWSAENGGMPPGLMNPLGARALYIFQNGKDTLYRVHGSSEASSIGKAVSSGCVRLLNQDVIDLYERVPPGSPILVI